MRFPKDDFELISKILEGEEELSGALTELNQGMKVHYIDALRTKIGEFNEVHSDLVSAAVDDLMYLGLRSLKKDFIQEGVYVRQRSNSKDNEDSSHSTILPKESKSEGQAIEPKGSWAEIKKRL